MHSLKYAFIFFRNAFEWSSQNTPTHLFTMSHRQIFKRVQWCGRLHLHKWIIKAFDLHCKAKEKKIGKKITLKLFQGYFTGLSNTAELSVYIFQNFPLKFKSVGVRWWSFYHHVFKQWKHKSKYICNAERRRYGISHLYTNMNIFIVYNTDLSEQHHGMEEK